MRALTLLTLVAVLAAAAFGQTVETSQETAKALRDHWKNCSQIVRGRLGALANPDDITNPNGLILTSSDGNFSVTYSPCAMLSDESVSRFAFFIHAVNHTDAEPQHLRFTMAATPDQVVQFYMPTKKGDVAHFVGTYLADTETAKHYKQATVTTNCGDSMTMSAHMDGTTLMITMNSMNACARFPYTNEAMPSGAIAALIVVIICFVLELAVCGWYHKTYSHDVPFSAGREDAYARHE